MSSVPPVTTSSTGSTTLSTPGTTVGPANTMGSNDFLDLMMDQLKNQNPLSPSNPTQYLSELASFSSLEQETNIATSTSTATTEQASAEALAMIGASVDYTDANGDTQTGTVSSVQFTASGPTLTIGTASGIALGSITEAS
ncbi:MAG: flagellar hook capping FlgD N-terminal domain-containing protein [Solirubrobacteraceae bacterium]